MADGSFIDVFTKRVVIEVLDVHVHLGLIDARFHFTGNIDDTAVYAIDTSIEIIHIDVIETIKERRNEIIGSMSVVVEWQIEQLCDFDFQCLGNVIQGENINDDFSRFIF